LRLELSPLVIHRHADDIGDLGRRLLRGLRSRCSNFCRIASASVM
jgi:hypothetical protein